MTTPWNTWTRSRLPSTTRTCTLRVSPGAQSGTSSRRLSRSIRSVGFMARSNPRRWPSWTVRERPITIAVLPEQSHLLVGEAAAALDQVGTALQGPHQGLGPPPAGHPGVVAAAQDFGDIPVPEGRGPG